MLLAAEARKHRALREVPVTLVLALVYFILNAEPQNPVQDQRTLWFLTQQDIRVGVGTGAAFLTAGGRRTRSAQSWAMPPYTAC